MPVRPTISNYISSSLLFLWIFMLVIFSWICISLWERWLNNLTFVTLKLDEKSPYHTFIIAIIVTLLIAAALIYLKSTGMNYETQVAGEYFADSDSKIKSEENDPLDGYIHLEFPEIVPFVSMIGTI